MVEEFNVEAANKVVATAMVDDAKSGAKSADVAAADMGRNRIQTAKDAEKRTAELEAAETALTTQQAGLAELDSQVEAVEAELRQSLIELASAALEPALQDYAKAADDLFLKLGRVYGISAVFGKNATNRFLRDIISIPSAGTKGFKHYGVFQGLQTAVTTTATHGELLQVESERFMKECLGG